MFKEDYTKVVEAYLMYVINSATSFTENDMDILYTLLIQRGYADPKPEKSLDSENKKSGYFQN